MSIEKTRVGDPNGTGKLDLHRDLEERVLRDTPPSGTRDSSDRPGKSIVEMALAARDTGLLRSIAAQRKGLTDEQRRALLLVADLLDLHGTPTRRD